MPAPLQWFVGRSMQPVKAAQLLLRMCQSSFHASIVRQWTGCQLLFETNWQLADSLLATYQRHCKAAKQRPQKSGRSVALMLSSMPSRYRLLLVPDLPSRVALVQQQLGVTHAELGQLIAAGAVLTSSEATLAAAMQWVVCFAGSREAAASMLRGAPKLFSYSAAMLGSKAAALQAAWAGTLQPEQVRQLVQRASMVPTQVTAVKIAPTAEVLCSWFPQLSELQSVLAKSPQLLRAPPASLEATLCYFMGLLSLSR